MSFAFDGPAEVTAHDCSACGRRYELVKALVSEEGRPAAVLFAAVHDHDAGPEVWMDIAMGSFAEPDFDDQVTLSCRVRSGDASLDCTLFQGPVAAEGKAAFFGRFLSPEGAREDLKLGTFWGLVDWAMEHEPHLATAI